MNRITNEQREAIVREAVAKRDALLTGAPMAKMPDTIAFDIRVHGVPAGYKLVPVEPPQTLLGHLTSYERVDYMDERDRNVILERLRKRWAGILAAIPEPDMRVTMEVNAGVKEGYASARNFPGADEPGAHGEKEGGNG